jgi:uncharacterized lipoprotein YddW (UPF0748 family)
LKKETAIERMAGRFEATRPSLAVISHWPPAPWEGEEILVRARFKQTPTDAQVFAAWRGLTGGLEGQSGRVLLELEEAPDPMTGEYVYRGLLAKGLTQGDVLAYRVEVETPGRTEPWKSYEQPVATFQQGTELRGTWVHTWSPVITTAEECRKLVENVRKANMNAICVEIRRRGDVFYNSSIEPKADSITPPDFDPLAELLRLCHDTSGGKAYVQVHGWFVIYPVGRGQLPDTTPPHPAKLHPDWATRLRDGSSMPNEIIFDPGLPEVQQYLVDLISECVRKYPIDGVNFDYVRYLESQRVPKPETLERYRAEKGLAAGAAIDFSSEEWETWISEQPDDALHGLETGYNPVAVARFNRQHNRPEDAMPDPEDPEWKQWKRDQVTAFVRKASTRINEIRPACMVTADTTGWGAITAWDESAPMNDVFQDWVLWMRKHYLDANFHMGYKREHVPEQKKDFREWTRFMIETDGGRYAVVGQGTYMNTPEAYRTQVEFARSLRAPGLINYSYQGYTQREAGWSLDQWIEWVHTTLFPQKVDAPDMPWGKHPTTGILQGTLRKADGTALDGAKVFLTDAEGSMPAGLIGTDVATKTDGTGFFAFTRVPPGEWSVIVVQPDGTIIRGTPRHVEAGQIAEAK